MEKQRKGITVAGSLIADVFYKIDTYPKEGMLVNVRGQEGFMGGTGNMIQDLAKMDPELPVTVSAIVGCDDRGEMLMRKLEEYPNIRTDQIVREGLSSVTMVMNAQDTKQRTFFFLPEASDRYDINCVDWDKLDSEIFHLEYLLLMKRVDEEDPEYGTHGARILHEAREHGMKTSIDIVSEQSDRAKRIVTSALKYTDYCAVNEIEAEGITGVDLTSSEEALKNNAEKALRKLAELGVARWAVVHSPAYGFGYDCEQDRFAALPSFHLPDGYIKGTNGAGDAYCSGILYAAQRGDSLEEAMYMAAACAACSLSEENGSDGVHTWQEILDTAKTFS